MIRTIRSILDEFDPRYANRYTKIIVPLVLLVALIGGNHTSIAEAYTAISGKVNAMGAPQNKGELRAYYPEFIAHNEKDRKEDADSHKRFVDDSNKLISILDGVIKQVNECVPCVVMKPPPNPAPNDFESLEPIVIPDIKGNDNEPLSDEDRKILDENERRHDANQDRHARNEVKREAYENYLKDLILYYLNPEIRCPEITGAPPVEIPVCELCPPPEVPTCPTCPPPSPVPPEVPCEYKMCGEDEPEPSLDNPANVGTPDPGAPIAPTNGASAGEWTEGWAQGNGDGSVGTSGGPGTPIVVGEPLVAP